MALETSLKFSFTDSLGENLSKTFSGISETVTDANARALGQACVTNKEAFGRMPAVLTAIEKIARETTEISLA